MCAGLIQSLSLSLLRKAAVAASSSKSKDVHPKEFVQTEGNQKGLQAAVQKVPSRQELWGQEGRGEIHRAGPWYSEN